MRRVAVVLCAIACGCTETGEPSEHVASAEAWTDSPIHPDVAGVADLEAGVVNRYLFVFDQSTSLQFTDEEGSRYGALADAIDELLVDPDAEVGFVGFANWSRGVPFTRDRDAMQLLLDPTGELGPSTDLQGALARSADLVAADITSIEAERRADLDYQVVVFIDGMPGPICTPGCAETDVERAYGGCNHVATLTLGADEYTDLPREMCPEYNTDTLLMARSRELSELASRSGANLDVHVRRLVPSLEPALREILQLDVDPTATLERVVHGGTYRDIDEPITASELLPE